MDSRKAEIDEIDYEFLPYLRVYKDGLVERLRGTEVISASFDPHTGVSSKDIVIIPELGISARLYLPKLTSSNHKLPLLVFFHGGAFCISSASDPKCHRFLNSLVDEASVVAVSVDYRRAPEHPLPTAYEDSWAALRWVVSHSNGEGSDPWLNNHADLDRVYLAGDSAGANIAYNMAMLAGNLQPQQGLGLELLGVALIQPYFWGSQPVGSEAIDPDRKAQVDRVWPFVCPSSPDNDDPRVNPVAAGAPSLAGLGCSRMLVCVAEKDVFRERGRLYYESLARSGWMGVAEIMETEGEDHIFHLNNPTCENTKGLLRRLASFFNRSRPPLP